MAKERTKRVILMANDRPGLKVCRYLIERGDQIVRLYIHQPDQQKFTDEIIKASGCCPDEIFSAALLKDPQHVKDLPALKADYIITVYWSYLIGEEVINSVKEGTVNFHPAMLPINRGWYPHVHSFIDGSPTGVTLHAIEKDADTGPIWAQKEIPIQPLDTAYTIYNRCQEEIVNLFRQTWPRIIAGEITPKPQDETKAVYHRKKEVNQLDQLDLDREMKVGEVINLLRARSFGDRGFAYYQQDGREVYVNLRLSETSDFSK